MKRVELEVHRSLVETIEAGDLIVEIRFNNGFIDHVKATVNGTADCATVLEASAETFERIANIIWDRRRTIGGDRDKRDPNADADVCPIHGYRIFIKQPGDTSKYPINVCPVCYAPEDIKPLVEASIDAEKQERERANAKTIASAMQTECK